MKKLAMSLSLLMGTLAAASAQAQEVGGAQAQGGLGPKVAFWALALLIVGGALVTITRKNVVGAVMALVATFFGMAGMYLLLSAEFLAALQVMVYAGAIMVLFVFVVMVLNRDEIEPWALRGIVTKGVGVAALAYLLVKTATYLFATETLHPEAPAAGFGGVADVGTKLFTTYLFPFEALSLMLLVAVIGAVVVARTPRRTIEAEHQAAREAAAVENYLAEAPLSEGGAEAVPARVASQGH